MTQSRVGSGEVRRTARSRLATVPKARSSSRTRVDLVHAKSEAVRDRAKPLHAKWLRAVEAEIEAGALIPSDRYLAKQLLNVPSANLGYDFQSFERIAFELGRTAENAWKQISRRCDVFEGLGLLQKERPKDKRSYKKFFCIDSRRLFPDSQLNLDLSTEQGDVDGTSMSGPDGTSMSGPDGTSMSPKLSSESELSSQQAIIGVEPLPLSPSAAPRGEHREGETTIVNVEGQAPPAAAPAATAEPEAAVRPASGLPRKARAISVDTTPQAVDGEILGREAVPEFTDVWRLHGVGYLGAAQNRWAELDDTGRLRFYRWLRCHKLLDEFRRRTLAYLLSAPPWSPTTPLAVLLDSPLWREEPIGELVDELRRQQQTENDRRAAELARAQAADVERREAERQRAEAAERAAEAARCRAIKDEEKRAAAAAERATSVAEVKAKIASDGIEAAREMVVTWVLDYALRVELEELGVLSRRGSFG
jgi:hypothetical protein